MGYRAVGGVSQRSLTRLALSSGVEVWTATWPPCVPTDAWSVGDGTAHNGWHSSAACGLHDSATRTVPFKSVAMLSPARPRAEASSVSAAGLVASRCVRHRVDLRLRVPHRRQPAL